MVVVGGAMSWSDAADENESSRSARSIMLSAGEPQRGGRALVPTSRASRWNLQDGLLKCWRVSLHLKSSKGSTLYRTGGAAIYGRSAPPAHHSM